MSALCSRRGCGAGAVPGGALCAQHDRHRLPNSEWARRRREAERLAQLKTAQGRCPWRTSGGHACAGPLQTETDALGRTIVSCAWCDRRRRGICRDCSRPVEGTAGRALRCAAHKHMANRESERRHVQRNHAELLRRARESYAEPERRAARNEYKRQWRKLNVEKVRAYKKRYIERHRGDPASWYNRYHARYRAKYRLQKRELERDRLAASATARRASPKCTRCGKSTRWKPIHNGHVGRPWTVCTKCLFPCERRARKSSRRRAKARAQAWLESIPAPAKIKRPPAMAIRGPGWERTCVTPNCDIVVTHRKKKCTKCRARDAAIAAEHLACRRGPGRRVDLEHVA